MARIAIVYLPDHTTVADIVDTGAPLNIVADQGRLVGLFEYPAHPGRKGTTCSGGCVKGRGWGRAKGGWMECGGCGRRNPNVRRWLIKALFDFLGANLYPDAPAAFRTPEGYGDVTQ
jgi:hypothetical protein